VRDDARRGAIASAAALDAASGRAKIEPAAIFHILRHTYASALAMKDVPMGVIAARFGHSDTRMTEKHYAHLSRTMWQRRCRRAPALGIVDSTNVAPSRGWREAIRKARDRPASRQARIVRSLPALIGIREGSR